MPDHGADLGVDLYKLLVVAKDDLPSVSAIYGDAVAKYGQARFGLDAAMGRPDHFGGDPGPVHAAWVDLYTAAEKFMKDTQVNLDDTATALVKAVDAYQAMDRGAAEELRRLRSERGEPKPGK